MSCLPPLCVSVFQERSGNTSFNHEALSLKYKLDNEFELIFVASHFLKLLSFEGCFVNCNVIDVSVQNLSSL